MDDAQARVITAISKAYLGGSQPPFSKGYALYREFLVGKTLADPELMERFARHRALPGGYGVRVDERCVEYPWVFARITDNHLRVLDAGSALNYKFLLESLVWKGKQLHILTLGPESQCHWMRGISYLYEDLRDMPIRDGFYDLVICISTLEHIGFDNSDYLGAGASNAQDNRPDDFVLAMRELSRVLKPGGTLLLTVPYGRYRDLGTQQVFDKARLERAIEAFEPGQVTRQFYAYAASGWQTAEESECGDCEYVEWIAMRLRERPSEFPTQPDGAVAARAVACLELTQRVKHPL